MLILSGISVALGNLYAAYNNHIFLNARMAINTLGQMLHLDSKATELFRRYTNETASQGGVRPDTDQAFKLLSAGVVAADNIGRDGIVEKFLPKADKMTFDGLRQLIAHSAQRPK